MDGTVLVLFVSFPDGVGRRKVPQDVARAGSEMAAEEKLAGHQSSLFELAAALGNASEAFRRRGVSRSEFYLYKRRFHTHGLEELKDLPLIPKSHPMTSSSEVVEKLLVLSLEHPVWGCDRLSALRKLEGGCVSGPTVQKFLNEHGMGTRRPVARARGDARGRGHRALRRASGLSRDANPAVPSVTC